MPASAPLPRRVLVHGVSGAGKSTLANRIAELLDLPRFELDALHHGPGWVPRPEFAGDVEAFSGTDPWVAEWQYQAVRPLLLARCDLMVWLDLPRRQSFARVVRRTVTRRLRRTELWNGNREGPLWRILVDRDHIIRWAWRTWPEVGRRAAWAASDRPDLEIVRLRSQREVEAWLADLAVRSGGGRPAPPR